MRPLVTSSQKKIWQTRHKYICTVDREHRFKHEFEGDNGETYKLFLPTWLSADHRRAHPNIGTVQYASEGAQFKPGQMLFVRHFTFEDHEGNPLHFHVEDGVEYYRVHNWEVMAAIDGDKLIPREGILLCSAIREKLYDTFLELPPELDDYRRDIARVEQVWDGCTEYKEGDYVILAKGGDYPFDFNKREYLKVDTYSNDVIAKVDSTEWRLGDVKKRIRDHSKPAGGSW